MKSRAPVDGKIDKYHIHLGDFLSLIFQFVISINAHIKEQNNHFIDCE